MEIRDRNIYFWKNTKQKIKDRKQKDEYRIYQLTERAPSHLRFKSYAQLRSQEGSVARRNYELIYAESLLAEMTLEDIFFKFNMDHPDDFKGHSLSVSDVVVLQRDGYTTAHYVDVIGYQEVPEFLQTEEH